MSGIARWPTPPADRRCLSLCALAIGLWLVVLQGLWWPAWWALALVLSLLLFVAIRLRAPLAGALAVLLLLHGSLLMQQRASSRLESPQNLADRELQVLAVQQQAAAESVRLLLQDQADGRRYRLTAWHPDWVPQAGDCVRADLRLRPPRGSHNFYGFDYSRWLYIEHIDATGSLRELRPCAGADHSSSAVGTARALPSTPLTTGEALLRALVYADRSGFDAGIWDTLGRSGAAHLFAISGLHVGLLALWAGGIGALLWQSLPWLQRRLVRKRCSLICAALGVVAYMGLAWGQISAQRAGLSAIAVLLLLASGRKLAPVTIWALALLCVLALDPLAILSPALGLSFAACLLLLALLPYVHGRSALVSLLLIQCALSVGLWPLTAAYFGFSSLLGVGLNLLLVPALAVFLPVALLAAGLQQLGWGWLWQQLAVVLDAGYALVQPWAAADGSVLTLPQVAMPVALSYVLAVVLMLQARLWRWRIAAALAGLVSAGVAWMPPAAPAPNTARMTVLDVGQGQAVVIETARHTLVYDTGPAYPRGRFDAGRMIVAPYLEARGSRSLALLIISHGDLDHAGGAAGLLAHVPAQQRWGIDGEDCEQGLDWQADGVRLRSIPLGATAAWTSNDRSCVVLLEVGATRVLLSGDIEAQAEQALLARAAEWSPVDVVLVPHHGSRTSSQAALVELLRPQLALASAGAFNRWNFPHPQVRARWQAVGARWYTTAAGGDIRLDLPELRVRRPPARPWRLEPLSSAHD